jgi:hypothetical protein
MRVRGGAPAAFEKSREDMNVKEQPITNTVIELLNFITSLSGLVGLSRTSGNSGYAA